jgi:tungstate transport system substrate-binding protein
VAGEVFSKRRRYMRMKRIAVFLGLLAALTLFPSSVSAQYKQIIVATGSPFELGLIDALAKVFEKETGCIVRCIKTPTGPGLELGRHGLTHITMGHHPAATKKFVQDGYAARRTDLMYNLTVIVGPKEDPAKIRGISDLLEAHKRIATARAKYLSRADGGGMNILEMEIWKKLNLQPEGSDWYLVRRKFMLESLLDADRGLEYHMLDSSTWALHQSKIKNLEVLVKGPKNEYEMCLVSVEKHPNLKYNQGLANQFYEFLISDKGQQLIGNFGMKEYGEPIYYPFAKK